MKGHINIELNTANAVHLIWNFIRLLRISGFSRSLNTFVMDEIYI